MEYNEMMELLRWFDEFKMNLEEQGNVNEASDIDKLDKIGDLAWRYADCSK